MKNGIMIKKPVEPTVPQTQTTNPLDMPTQEFQAGLNRRKANRRVLMDWIKSALIKDKDYGSIQINGRPSKASLFKPGAEKICGMLGIIPTFPNLHRYEEMALSGKEVKTIILKCELTTSDGKVIASGIGARQVGQDNGDINKALKMASKSAHIDATLRAAGLSEIFTQDVEDMNLAVEEVKPEPSDEKCTNKQFTTMVWLRDHMLVTEKEQARISELLEKGPTREEAFSILEYFLGKSRRDPESGRWIKEEEGVLAQREADEFSE